MVTVCGETWSRAVGPSASIASIEAAAGRVAGAVDRDDLAVGGSVEAEAVAAQSGRLRLDDREHGAGRDSGVDGVAPSAQDLDGGQRGDRHRRRRHAICGVDGAASVLVEIPQWSLRFGWRANRA